MFILAALAEVAKQANAIGNLRVVRYHGAAVAIRAKVLAWIETEASNVAESADALSIPTGAVRLRCVFNYAQFVRGRDLENRAHRNGLSVQMHRNNGFCARSDRGFDERG